ncbi:hypothetical protein HYZ70_03405 [Candidatus Curtissbacteria bacterium]|nr:hypothetical protein [Candidatus Curtissbacteria bacterium]
MQQRINITLPPDLARDLRRNIPDRSRSKFITEAIREKFKKQDLKAQLKKSARSQAEIIRQIQEDFKYVDAEELAKLS